LPARHELKFLVNEEQRARVLADASGELQPDPHTGANGAYRVTSQYYDSPGLAFYWEKVDGVRERKKIRLRTYGEIGGPADLSVSASYMEIKRRRGDLIAKERVRVLPESTLRLLEDGRALQELSRHVADGVRDTQTVGSVERAALGLSLVPANVITYRREAYQSVLDTRLRLTFDHEALAMRPEAYFSPDGGIPITQPGIAVMELKFNGRIPRWIRDLLVAHAVRLQRFSKYAAGVDALLDTRLQLDRS
jgi:SPX domain protein involved in polyphosphate accumulation